MEKVDTYKPISFFEFIKKADEDGAVFIIPELQRPYKWGIDKLKNMFNDVKNDFFGTITLMETSSKNEFLVIDGQQRLSTFLIAYNLAIGIKSESMLENRSFTDNEAAEFKKLFGKNENLKNCKSTSEFKNLRKFGYTSNFNYFQNMSNSENDKIVDFLEKSYMSITVIPINLNKYSVFVSMNNSGIGLGPTDLIRALLHENFSEQRKPIKINSEWQSLISTVLSADANLDYEFTSFLNSSKFSQKTSFTKKTIHKFIVDKIAEVNNASYENNEVKKMAMNNFIIDLVDDFKKHINLSVVPLTVSEKIESTLKRGEDILNALRRFVVESNVIYVPLKMFVLRASEAVDDNLNNITEFIKILILSIYLSEVNNKYRNLILEEYVVKEVSDNIKPIPSNIFRENMAKFFESKPTEFTVRDLVGEKIFNVENVAIFDDQFVWNGVWHNITNYFLNENVGNTFRAVFEWYLNKKNSSLKKSYFDYMNLFDVEHVYQKTKHTDKIVDKRQCIVFLEKDDHINMNADVIKIDESTKKSKFINEYFDTKLKYYKNSKSFITNSYNRKYATKKWFVFYVSIEAEKIFRISYFKDYKSQINGYIPKKNPNSIN